MNNVECYRWELIPCPWLCWKILVASTYSCDGFSKVVTSYMWQRSPQNLVEIVQVGLPLACLYLEFLFSLLWNVVMIEEKEGRCSSKSSQNSHPILVILKKNHNLQFTLKLHQCVHTRLWIIGPKHVQKIQNSIHNPKLIKLLIILFEEGSCM